MLRARLVFAGLSLFVALGAAAACGLDESGTSADGSVDVVVGDVGPDGPSDAPIDAPKACTTLDASACFDGSLPSDWTYVLFAQSDAACPSADFTVSQYDYGLALQPGACACSTCTTDGGYSCAGQIEAGSKTNGCNGEYLVFDAGDDATCVDAGFADPHLAIDSLPTVSGNPTCSTTENGTHAFTASTATACTPAQTPQGCAVDYCGAAAPFSRCILSTTSTAGCTIGPFTQPTPLLGTPDKVAVSCDTCACGVLPPAPCGATFVASPNHDCSNPYNGAVPTTGACVQPGGAGNDVNSFLYTPTVPLPSCALTDGGTGSVNFASTVTVCCIP